MEAEILILSLQDQIRSAIQWSQRGSILVDKDKLCSQKGRGKLVRWRRSKAMRRRNGKPGESVLDLAEKKCWRQLWASEELSRNGQRGIV